MSADDYRLLDPEQLPASLWDSTSETLLLPPALAQVYRTLLDRHNLRSVAESRGPNDSPRGGITQEKTDEHLAKSFDGSAARAQLAVIDPKMDVTRVSNSIIQLLSGNEACITDAPCGAGAAVLTFLATVAELRSTEVLPREPLDVHIIGAEISAPARKYASEILDELRPILEEQAIFITAEFLGWDVTDPISNTDLIRNMTVMTSDVPKHLLIVANFNGFLEKERKRTEAQRQIEELFRHASGNNCIAIWIEPQMNTALTEGGLFTSIIKLVTELWHRFANVNTEGVVANPVLKSECKFQSPVNFDKSHKARLAVMRIDLGRVR